MHRSSLLRRIPTAYLVALLGAGVVVLLSWMSRGQLNPVIAGAEAPAFSAQDAEGVVRSTDEYGGKVLLVNIWATWCETCKEEMPSMQRLYDQLGRDDFEILAVSVDAPIGQDDLRFGLPGGDPFAYADSLSLSFPILHDPSARIAAAYRITGVPESFVIDRDGIIIRKIAGPAEWDAAGYLELFERLIEQ